MRVDAVLQPKAKKQKTPHAPEHADVIVIGAGPTGLACAIEAKKIGAKVIALDKGCIVNSLYHYPHGMVFFTTPELLEIGDLPFTTARQKPTREEALEYYRNCARFYQLDVRQYQRVEAVIGKDGEFCLRARDAHGREFDYIIRKIVLATGYYDLPNMMSIPGEKLPKVMHYYHEPHAYYDTDVVVIGAKNSAAIAALDLWRHGARVTMVVRGGEISKSVKYWIKPDIENRIANKEIAAFFHSRVIEVRPESVLLETPEGTIELENDFVFALTGYHPDFDFLRAIGIELAGEDRRPICDPETLESNVPGVYVAGVIVAGMRTNEIFIENGRFHGQHIARDLAKKLSK